MACLTPLEAASSSLGLAPSTSPDELRSACNGPFLRGPRLLLRHGPASAATTAAGRHERIGFTLSMSARIRKGKRSPNADYPWPEMLKGDLQERYLAFLSRFKPLNNSKSKLTTLPFERPLVDLESKIEEVKKLAKKTGMDFTQQINELELKYIQLRKELYQHLTPVQRLSVARHPCRPTFLDHVLNITDKWIELHGDRAGYDDPSIVTGIGKMDGMSIMFIGHQKGRNTKENIYRNFGMPTPNGYRKALRMMLHADHHGFPIITFIDTPGAYAGVKAEELGQGEAIARNLREMFGLKVPIITVVIGEGGSGGALAIGCCNKMLMLENAVYYVARKLKSLDESSELFWERLRPLPRDPPCLHEGPEACAAILWKNAAAAPKAAEALRITSYELKKLRIVDEIIKEPIGAAHSDPIGTADNLKAVLVKHVQELIKLDVNTLVQQRHAKFRSIGAWQEGKPLDPFLKRAMKKRDKPLVEEGGVEEASPKSKPKLKTDVRVLASLRSRDSLQPVNATANHSLD